MSYILIVFSLHQRSHGTSGISSRMQLALGRKKMTSPLSTVMIIHVPFCLSHWVYVWTELGAFAILSKSTTYQTKTVTMQIRIGRPFPLIPLASDIKVFRLNNRPKPYSQMRHIRRQGRCYPVRRNIQTTSNSWDAKNQISWNGKESPQHNRCSGLNFW